jgi:hypothetical protein
MIKTKITKKIKADAEYYFIQFLFCTNREILMKKWRKFYDYLFRKYVGIYARGKAVGADLSLINETFTGNFKIKKVTPTEPSKQNRIKTTL